MSRSTLALIAGMSAVVVLAALWSRRFRVGTPAEPSVRAPMQVSREVVLPSAAQGTSPPALETEPALAPSAIARSSRLDLASPQATVETQLELLRGGRDSELRTTFLPSVSVTNEAIEACKRRIRSVPVRPDWEMAEDRIEQGHRVRRVSMFGKSMTGFHEMGRVWLADAVWCVPVGLP